VSTVLELLAKPALVNWAAWSVANYIKEQFFRKERGDITGVALAQIICDASGNAKIPWELSDLAKDIGSAIHKVVEKFGLDGKEPTSIHPVIRPHVDSAMKLIKESGMQIQMVECSVISEKHGYGGTLDAISLIQVEEEPKLFLMDWKKGKDAYREQALQLAAYRHADFIAINYDDVVPGFEVPKTWRKTADGLEIPMPQVDGSLVALLDPSGPRLVEWDTTDETFEAFLNLLALWRWTDTKPKAKLWLDGRGLDTGK